MSVPSDIESYLRCPTCKRLLERSDLADDNSVSYTYRCPKCKYYREVKMSRPRTTPSLDLSIGKTLAKYRGDIGEKIAFKVLIDKGYDIESFHDLVSELGDDYKTFRYPRFSEEHLKKFFGKKYLQNFIKFCETWTKDSETPSGKLRERTELTPRFRSSHFGFDWIGKKDGRFYIIEVKTNRGGLRKFQKKMLMKARDFGFIPLVIRVKVEVSVPLSEVRIEKLL